MFAITYIYIPKMVRVPKENKSVILGFCKMADLGGEFQRTRIVTYKYQSD